jgi:myosin heavy subunit
LLATLTKLVLAWLALQLTRRAMTLVGIPEEEQVAVCRTVAAVLHLGNLVFLDGPEEDSSVLAPVSERHLAATAELLGVDRADLLRSLTTRTRHTVDGERSRGALCWLADRHTIPAG